MPSANVSCDEAIVGKLDVCRSSYWPIGGGWLADEEVGRVFRYLKVILIYGSRRASWVRWWDGGMVGMLPRAELQRLEGWECVVLCHFEISLQAQDNDICRGRETRKLRHVAEVNSVIGNGGCSRSRVDNDRTSVSNPTRHQPGKTRHKPGTNHVRINSRRLFCGWVDPRRAHLSEADEKCRLLAKATLPVLA